MINYKKFNKKGGYMQKGVQDIQDIQDIIVNSSHVFTVVIRGNKAGDHFISSGRIDFQPVKNKPLSELVKLAIKECNPKLQDEIVDLIKWTTDNTKPNFLIKIVGLKNQITL
jgi:hypothetical protein